MGAILSPTYAQTPVSTHMSARRLLAICTGSPHETTRAVNRRIPTNMIRLILVSIIPRKKNTTVSSDRLIAINDCLMPRRIIKPSPTMSTMNCTSPNIVPNWKSEIRLIQRSIFLRLMVSLVAGVRNGAEQLMQKFASSGLRPEQMKQNFNVGSLCHYWLHMIA